MKNNNTHCLNCGQQLLGGFCHRCGQADINANLTFTELVRDFLGDMFTYDSRFYRTIVPLLIKPGFLTLEFFKGRRAPYVPPLRLYLFISFILFLWMAVVGNNSINVGDTEEAKEEVSANISAAIGSSESEIASRWLSDADESAQALLDNPKAFINLVTSRFPYLMFLLLPIFTLILWLHFAFSGFNYLQHFVFTLHFHSFIYLLNLIFSIIDQIIPWSFTGLALLVFNIYAVLGFRRAYGSTVFGAIMKTFSILFIYLIVFFIAFIVFLVINVLSLK